MSELKIPSKPHLDFHPLIKYRDFSKIRPGGDFGDCFICNHLFFYQEKRPFDCANCETSILNGYHEILKSSMLDCLMNICIDHLNWIKEGIPDNLCYDEMLKNLDKEICFYEELKKNKQKLRNWALLNKNSDNKRIKFVCIEVLDFKQ